MARPTLRSVSVRERGRRDGSAAPPGANLMQLYDKALKMPAN